MALWILSGTTRVSWYQKGKTKTNLDFLEQETVSGNGISWALCKYPLSFFQADAFPATEPTASKH